VTVPLATTDEASVIRLAALSIFGPSNPIQCALGR
jgi:hypothetical protein